MRVALRSNALCLMLGFPVLAPAQNLPLAMIAEGTYKGQAAMFTTMPTMFKATGRFKIKEVTGLCPEALQYPKLREEEFLTPADLIDSYLRSPLEDAQKVGQQSLNFHLESEICQTLQPGTVIEVVAAYLPITGCQKAWMSAEYVREVPNTPSYSCFYIPAVISGGKMHMVPGIHVEGFDEWASKEWQNYKVTP